LVDTQYAAALKERVYESASLANDPSLKMVRDYREITCFGAAFVGRFLRGPDSLRGE
jgi:hypothetical protein